MPVYLRHHFADYACVLALRNACALRNIDCEPCVRYAWLCIVLCPMLRVLHHVVHPAVHAHREYRLVAHHCTHASVKLLVYLAVLNHLLCVTCTCRSVWAFEC